MPDNYEFGRHWSPKIPRGSISHVIRKFHVSLHEDDAAGEIERRCEGRPGWSREAIVEAMDYARACHRANVDLYSSVMRG